jgi:prenyltransferase beta subunit
LDRISRFVLSRQQPDGGFRGQAPGSSLYPTLFAVATLKVIDYPIPVFKVWKYLLSLGTGKGLDLVHLVGLIRLRSAFPMLGTTRRRMLRRLDDFKQDSISAQFFKRLAREVEDFAGAEHAISPDDSTLQLVAAVAVNQSMDPAIENALLSRWVASGGFAASKHENAPDLRSTAAALWILVEQGTKLGKIQPSCFKYIESLWRSSGGFAGKSSDESAEVEFTFYALLAMGYLTQSLVSSNGD